MIHKFWNAIDTKNYELIETILDNNPNFLFENKQHYVTYGIDRTRLRMELAR
mgnify:CR=1 FL=1